MTIGSVILVTLLVWSISKSAWIRDQQARRNQGKPLAGWILEQEPQFEGIDEGLTVISVCRSCERCANFAGGEIEVVVADEVVSREFEGTVGRG